MTFEELKDQLKNKLPTVQIDSFGAPKELLALKFFKDRSSADIIEKFETAIREIAHKSEVDLSASQPEAVIISFQRSSRGKDTDAANHIVQATFTFRADTKNIDYEVLFEKNKVTVEDGTTYFSDRSQIGKRHSIHWTNTQVANCPSGTSQPVDFEDIILVVDDQENGRFQLQKLIERFTTIPVKTFTNGEGVVAWVIKNDIRKKEAAKQNQKKAAVKENQDKKKKAKIVRFVGMDRQMEYGGVKLMDGIVAAGLIKRFLPANTAIVMFSADSPEELKQQDPNNYLSGFIQKGYSSNTVRNTLVTHGIPVMDPPVPAVKKPNNQNKLPETVDDSSAAISKKDPDKETELGVTPGEILKKLGSSPATATPQEIEKEPDLQAPNKIAEKSAEIETIVNSACEAYYGIPVLPPVSSVKESDTQDKKLPEAAADPKATTSNKDFNKERRSGVVSGGILKRLKPYLGAATPQEVEKEPDPQAPSKIAESAEIEMVVDADARFETYPRTNSL